MRSWGCWFDLEGCEVPLVYHVKAQSLGRLLTKTNRVCLHRTTLPLLPVGLGCFQVCLTSEGPGEKLNLAGTDEVPLPSCFQLLCLLIAASLQEE